MLISIVRRTLVFPVVLALLPVLGFTAGCTAITGVETIIVYTALEPEQISKYGQSPGHSDEPLSDRYLDVFHRSHPGIVVIPHRKSTISLLEEDLKTEKATPGGIKADVVWGVASTILLDPALRDAFQPYGPEGLAALKDANNGPGDDGSRFADPLLKEPTLVGFDVRMAAFCVNASKIRAANLSAPEADCTVAGPDFRRDPPPEAFKLTWKDLGQGCLKEHVSLPNPEKSGTGFLVVTGLLQNFRMDDTAPLPAGAIQWSSDLTMTGGLQQLKAIDNNVKVYPSSGEAPCALANQPSTSGLDIWIGVSLDYHATNRSQKFPNVKPAFPRVSDRGQSGWEVEANALVKKARPEDIKPAAKVFLDWTLTEEAMNLYRQNYAVVAIPSTTTSIPKGYPQYPPDGTGVLAPVKALAKQLYPNNDILSVATYRQTILNAWRAIILDTSKIQ